jgi:hypothetical protein
MDNYFGNFMSGPMNLDGGPSYGGFGSYSGDGSFWGDGTFGSSFSGYNSYDPYSSFYGDNSNSLGGGNSLGDAFDPFSTGFGGTDNGETLGGGGSFQGVGMGSFQPRSTVGGFPSINLPGGLGSLAPLIGGAIDATRQGDASKTMLDWMNKQQAGLSDLFNVGSPYYKQMWDDMSAKDAAAGRNSQYGPRSVELAGRMAPLQAQTTVGMTNALARPYASAVNQNATKYTGLIGAIGNALKSQQQPSLQSSGGGGDGFGSFLGAVGGILGLL